MGTIILFCALFAAIIGFGISRIISGARTTRRDDIVDAQGNSPAAGEEVKTEDSPVKESTIEEEFGRRTAAGEKSVLFLKLSNQADGAILRSMLFSADIPSVSQTEHSSGLFGTPDPVSTSSYIIKLYILENDYDSACEIVKDFKSSGHISIEPKQ